MNYVPPGLALAPADKMVWVDDTRTGKRILVREAGLYPFSLGG